jgi:hypothetical protein
MRIDPNRPIKSVATRRGERAGSTGASSFADMLGAEATAATGAAAPVGAAGSLLALQEVSDELTRRRQAMARGASLLDQLDELRLGLLTGSISRDKLAGLTRMVRSARGTVADPGLQQVLDEIELRAEVELAKLAVET